MKKHEFLTVLLICLGLTFIFSSCKDKVHEELIILIVNKTDSLIHINLYPQKTTPSGVFYPKSDKGGMHGLCEFDLSPHEECALFYTGDLNINPHILSTRIFDSIYVDLKNTEETIIKFTHEHAIGYSENIFKESSTWDYKIEEWDMHTGRNSKVRDYCYTFAILENNFIAH